MTYSKFEQLEKLQKSAFENSDASVLEQIPRLLNDWGVRCREDDGVLSSINISTPVSVGGTIAVGLRYVKRDRTLTEDLFTVSSSSPNSINSHYKATQEREFTEYKGTHKQQGVQDFSTTSVNTCCYVIPVIKNS